MLTWIASRLMFLLNILICSTLKYNILNEPPAPKLFAFWHGSTFPLFHWARHRKIYINTIETWRGKVIAHIAYKYGYETFQMKETGTPLERSKTLTDLIARVKNGYDIGMAVDGPPPPLTNHKAKPGVILMSKMTNIPIVPVKIEMKKKLTCFWRWDKYEIPLPYSEVIINFRKPVRVDEKFTVSDLEQLLD